LKQNNSCIYKKRIFRKNGKRSKTILKYDEYSDILSVKDGQILRSLWMLYPLKLIEKIA
jgi:hypothetical protein